MTVNKMSERPSPSVPRSTQQYRYASLKDGDKFCEMRRYAISSLCVRHRVYTYLRKLR